MVIRSTWLEQLPTKGQVGSHQASHPLLWNAWNVTGGWQLWGNKGAGAPPFKQPLQE